MNYTHLSLDQAPDIWSPLRFFLSAPLFAMAATLLLIITGPDVFQNRWLPQTLAITHIITLGFITMVMMGALFQLLPVLAGSAIYQSKMSSRFIHRLMVIGVALFGFGFFSSDTRFIKLSLFFIVPALMFFLILVSIALYKATSKFASARGMRFSVSALWVVLVLGMILATGTAWEEVPLLRELTSLHVIWAVLGWVFTMIVSVAFQVIPMFQVTTEYSDEFKQWFFVALFICLIVVSILFFLNYSAYIIYFIISALMVLFAVLSGRLLMQRKKRLADASLYYWLTGLVSLVVSVLLFNYEIMFHGNLNVYVGVVFFCGFVVSIINGMLFKIVPFLVWLHLNKKLAFTEKGLSSVPTMNEVISRKKMLYQYILHMCALILTLCSFFFPNVFFNIAMIVWLLSFGILFFYLLQSVRMYYACLKSA